MNADDAETTGEFLESIAPTIANVLKGGSRQPDRHTSALVVDSGDGNGNGMLYYDNVAGTHNL